MTLRELRFLVASDVYRYHGDYNRKIFLREFFFGIGGKYSIWMRLCTYLVESRFLRPLYPVARLVLKHYTFKFGIAISPRTKVGPGLYIGHWGGVIVSGDAVIGRNCELSQDVTIGVQNRGLRKGVPTIGDNVYIAPGARIFGGIKVGDNVAVGANCVVTKDVPDCSVVVGIPGRVISDQGSFGIIDKTDYERFRKQ
jgi:serine O-acetyltransferase